MKKGREVSGKSLAGPRFKAMVAPYPMFLLVIPLTSPLLVLPENRLAQDHLYWGVTQVRLAVLKAGGGAV